MNIHSLPGELRRRRQWVVWRFELRNEKQTKAPYVATNPRRRASTTDPGTWGCFGGAARALEAGHADGVGFVFTDDDPFGGVDLDGCISGRQPLAVEAWAVDIIRRLNSYTEVSPSGTGLHVIVRAQLGEGRRKGPVEVYDRARYFCMTGDRLGRLPASPMPRQTALDDLVATLRPPPTHRPATPIGVGIDLDDEELLRRACGARNGAQVARLWSGDWEGYPSQSEADAALCRHLAYWCGGDPDRVDRLFRMSGLYRAKWDRPDYRERTLELATGSRR